MRVLRGFLAVATVVSSGCVNFDPDRSQEKFEPLERASSESRVEEEIQDRKITSSADALPKPNFKIFDDVLSYEKIVVETDSETKIQANFRNMPLPEFINETIGKNVSSQGIKALAHRNGCYSKQKRKALNLSINRRTREQYA